MDIDSFVREVNREISPVRRFIRYWLLMVIIAATAVIAVQVEPSFEWYALLFLGATNALAVVIYAEEAINKWKEKTTTNSTLS